MPSSFRSLGFLFLGASLVLGGCSPANKETVRDKKSEDPMAWSGSPISHDAKDEDAAADKGGIFGGKRIQGGMDDTSRDIERSLGVH